MQEYIKSLLKSENIFLTGVVPLSHCIITKQYLLDRSGIRDGSVVCFAIPYYTDPGCTPNISAYAYAQDYHLYVKQLSERLLANLNAEYPGNKFAFFADHSPIDERHAAALSGLGIIGKHGMLITSLYSSYVFIAEIITDAVLTDTETEIKYCEMCGKCEKACPYGLKNGCLSALTQKKGELCADEIKMMLKYGSAWGCDICSEACPHTEKARKDGTIFSPISYFSENLIPYLTLERVKNMSDDFFSNRAYAWRGRKTIERNLELFEKKTR